MQIIINCWRLSELEVISISILMEDFSPLRGLAFCVTLEILKLNELNICRLCRICMRVGCSDEMLR